jgi:hypothetical protein
VIFKIKAMHFTVPDDYLVDNLDRGAPLFMLPKHFVGGKANREVVTEDTRFFEKLNMSSVENIVAARNKDFFHE